MRSGGMGGRGEERRGAREAHKSGIGLGVVVITGCLEQPGGRGAPAPVHEVAWSSQAGGALLPLRLRLHGAARREGRSCPCA